MTSYFPKRKFNILSYRNYKRFRNNSFRNELDNKLLNYELYNIENQHFLNIFWTFSFWISILLSRKSISDQIKVILLQNNSSKAIMKWSKLCIIFLKEKSEVFKETIVLFFWGRLKRNFWRIQKFTADNKKFWQTVNPLFSDKICHREAINLLLLSYFILWWRNCRNIH